MGSSDISAKAIDWWGGKLSESVGTWSGGESSSSTGRLTGVVEGVVVKLREAKKQDVFSKKVTSA